MAVKNKSKTTKKNPPAKKPLHAQARQKAKKHYYQIMPNKRWHRTTVWIIFWIASGIILSQLIYPPNRVLPTASLLGQPMIWKSEAQLVAQMQQLFDKTTVKLKTADNQLSLPIKLFGAEPDTASMSQKVTDYPFWQRYIPLSIFMRQPNIDNLTLTYTNLVSQSACRQYAKQLTTQPVDARIGIENNQLVATAERPGHYVDPTRLCLDIQTSQLRLAEQNIIEVSSETVQPKTTADDLAEVRSKAEQALAAKLQFDFENESYRPESAVVASWLKISGNQDKPSLSLDKQRLKDYLGTINQAIGKPAGTTNVTVVNGHEVNRAIGVMGRTVDYDQIIDQVTKQLLENESVQPIEINLVDVAPTIVYNNRYTNSEAGLKAYVLDAANRYDAHISIRQLNGEGWRAAARENDSIVSASTYKLYVAMWLFDEMSAGRTNWDAPILGTTVSDCFDQMTIASTNPCSIEWLAQFGRENMNNYLYKNGFSRKTSFTNPLATHTTASDLTNYMTRLSEGSLVAGIYRQRLYQSLSSHPYRYGIPSGSAGRVYDKVGFLWDYVHDTAIVEHPKGRYVMTVMTKGQSYARIASITREVERIMYGQ